MEKRKFLSRLVTGVMLMCFMTVSTACYGPFNLTRNVYHWNSGIKGSGEVNDKWMKELVFFGMIVIPVYMFSALLDAFIFNSIQFWSGDNPVKVTQDQDGRIREVRAGETTITITKVQDSRSETVAYWVGGKLVRTATLVETTAGYALLNEAGQTLSEAQLQLDGGIKWLNSDCEVAASLSDRQVKTATAQLAHRS
jgi:Domain of unknown function (DUF3332)